MKSVYRNFLVFSLFAGLTLVLTYPIVLNLGSGMRDLGDPLLNCWIISWNIHKISHLDFSNYYDANIFYPHKRTLAYSEFLITQTLAALPVWVISKNPILAYNIILLLSFITSGLGMFFLARYLTKDTLAAIVAGLIYAFSPFMFAHLFQIQVLAAGGIPLVFLFLHKFFTSHRFQDVLLFSLFFILQVLANGYYALYLILFGGLFVLVFGIAKKKFTDIRFLAKLAGGFLIVFLLAVPFYFQYIKVRNEMGFSREIGAYARVTSFLATSPLNRIYGRITAPFLISEGELFPGIAAFLLALAGIIFYIRRFRKKTYTPKKKSFLYVYRLLSGLFAFCLILSLFIYFSGGFQITIKGLGKFSAHGLTNPLVFAMVFLIGRAVVQRVFLVKKTLPVERDGKLVFGFYLGIFVLAFLFTLGPNGPYYLLYHYVPGFDGIRVASRFHIFVMFSLSLFAAFGLKECLPRLSLFKRRLISVVIPLLILAEYFSAPIPLYSIPVKKQIPEVYQWLASKKGEAFAVIEIPLPHPGKRVGSLECFRVYYSIYHWKNLVNGFSGYFPPLYNELCRRWLELPMEQNIRDLKKLGIRYMIFHQDAFRQPELRKAREELSNMKEGELRLVHMSDEDYVFELTPESEPSEAPILSSQFPKLPNVGWNVHSNVNTDLAPLAMDDSLLTRWECGPQKKGIYFEIDLGRLTAVNGFSLKIGKSFLDFPRGYFVELSRDGSHWWKVAEEKVTLLPFRVFLQPKDFALDVFFTAQEARFIRITNTGEDPVFYWSIYEIEVFREGTALK
ncbi:MAG: discoidin domain-containing protein [Candidatus Aminicenantales bacterium]